MVTKRDRFGIYRCMVDGGGMPSGDRNALLEMLGAWGFDLGVAGTMDDRQLGELVKFLADRLGAPPSNVADMAEISKFYDRHGAKFQHVRSMRDHLGTDPAA